MFGSDVKTATWQFHAGLFLILYSGTATFAVPLGVEAFYLAALAVPLIWASVTDLFSFVIPDLAVAIVAALGLTYPFLLGTYPDVVTLVTSGIVVTVLALTGEFYWRRHRVEALGLGDVKLIGAGILVVGVELMWLMILIAASGGIFAALMARWRSEKGIPFGPFLAYAIFVVQALRAREL